MEGNGSGKNIFTRMLVLKISLALAPFFLILIVIMGVMIMIISVFGDDSGGGFSGGGNVVSNNSEYGFTISQTSLSRSEFKSKISEYASTHPHWQIFVDNADEYYNYAVSVNVNPELVITVANKENGGKELSKNNYWGLDCPNESTRCGDIPSFMDGAKRLIDSASRFQSLIDWFVIGNYSYIGTYWYNPGNWGLGGCAYKDLIYPNDMPARVKNACEPNKTCLAGGVGSCIKTTDEDQMAYAKYLVGKMAEFRKTVFGLEPDEGVLRRDSLVPLDSYNLRHEGLNVLNHTLSDSERNDLDSYIDSEIKKAGYGTGSGVASAGQSLINWLEKKGYYLQYRWGGGHSYSTNCSGDSSDFTFSNSYWGDTCGYDDHDSSRKYFGMDCSGFVSWATRTACKAGFNQLSGSWIGLGKAISLGEAQPGDILDKDGHVRLVIKNNGDGSVIIAEETGAPVNGLVFNKVDNASSYTVVSMEEWYASNCTTR